MNPDNTFAPGDDSIRKLTKTVCDRIDREQNSMYRANICINKRMDRPSVTDIFGTWDCDEILICAAGPSFYVNIDEIEKKAADPRVKVIAVERVFSALKEAGIRPDLTISCDPYDRMIRHFDADYIEDDDVFVMNMVQSPDVMRLVKDTDLYFYLPILPMSSYFQDKFRKEYYKKYFGLKAAMVVTTCAIDLALWLFEDRNGKMVSTIGNELCWREGNIIAPDHEEILKKREVFVILGDGSKVRTVYPFYEAAMWLQYFPLNHPETRWMDYSAGIAQKWEFSRIGH